MMARTILGKSKRGRPKKGQKTHNPKGSKRGKELISFVVGKFSPTAPLMSLTCEL
jgi:hypothetical protein